MKVAGKMEIYPYQRVVAESSQRNERHRKRATIAWFRKWQQSIAAYLVKVRSNTLTSIISIENLIIGLTAMVMARAYVLEEILPFAFAFTAAFVNAHKNRGILLALFTIAGFISVENGHDLYLNILTMVVLIVIINQVDTSREKDWWTIPVLTLSVLFVVKSLYVVVSGFTFYKEMIIVFEAIIAAVLTFVFVVGSGAVQEKKALIKYSFEEIAAFVVVSVGIVIGLNDINLYGVSISSILCRLGILVAAFIWGSGGATVVGVMAGIIPSISTSIFTQSLTLYAVSGLLAGMFANLGRFGVILGFMLGNLAASMFFPPSQLALVGIKETMAASLLFLILPDSLKEKVAVNSFGSLNVVSSNPDLKLVDDRIKEVAKTRITELAGVFKEISGTFAENKATNYKPDQAAYLNYLYNEILRGFCKSCSRYQTCWDYDCYNTSQKVLDLFTLAETSGSVDYEKCSLEFKNSCIYGREIVNTINYLFDNLRINEYWSEKLDESRDLVVAQLQGVSNVVQNLVEEINMKTSVDYELRTKLLKESAGQGLKIKEIIPVKAGEDPLQLHIVAESCTNNKQCEEIVGFLSPVIGERLTVAERKCPHAVGRGTCEFILSRNFYYKVISGAAQVGKEKICGDSFTIATMKQGKELIALSDGMGVGEKAYNESQAAVRLLKNLLDTGISRDMALKTINSVLFLRSTTESFATLDMAMIDLYTAEIDFIKTGSAPSFIKRGRQVEVVTSNSVPIGILDTIDVSTEKRFLYPRDMVVLVSDGVLEVARHKVQDMWVKDMLAVLDESNPNVVAEIILNEALRICNGKPKDDMTVVCLYIDING